MIKILFTSITILLFLSCQNKSVPQPKNSNVQTTDFSKNKKEITPQKAVKNDKSSTEKDNKIYKIMEVDVRPDYVGGIHKFYSFLNKNYIMPKDPDSNDVLQGGVFSNFIIEKDGSISNIEILHDIGYGTGKELERVLKLSPNWTPAVKDGKPVRCLYSMPYYVTN